MPDLTVTTIGSTEGLYEHTKRVQSVNVLKRKVPDDPQPTTSTPQQKQQPQLVQGL